MDGGSPVKRLALIVCGTRDTIEHLIKWRNMMEEHLIALAEKHTDVVVIHGACGEDADGSGEMKGIDRIANVLAVYRYFDVVPVPAAWSTWGRSAGPRRNAQMSALQSILGLHGYDMATFGYTDAENAAGSGTWDMIRRSEGSGVPDIRVYGSDGVNRYG
jgi:hypothetical protein